MQFGQFGIIFILVVQGELTRFEVLRVSRASRAVLENNPLLENNLTMSQDSIVILEMKLRLVANSKETPHDQKEVHMNKSIMKPDNQIRVVSIT